MLPRKRGRLPFTWKLTKREGSIFLPFCLLPQSSKSYSDIEATVSVCRGGDWGWGGALTVPQQLWHCEECLGMYLGVVKLSGGPQPPVWPSSLLQWALLCSHSSLLVFSWSSNCKMELIATERRVAERAEPFRSLQKGSQLPQVRSHAPESLRHCDAVATSGHPFLGHSP